MKSNGKLKRFLLAPLVYTAAVVLLIEEWLWDGAAKIMARLASLAAIKALESRISRLSPYAALAAFALPALFLFPIKILALFAIAHGHAGLGVTVIVAAKLGGTALAARLYGLTKPALMSLTWFARGMDRFIKFKNRIVVRLRATRAWRKVNVLASAINVKRQLLWAKFKYRYFRNGKLGRLIRKFSASKRTRQRQE